MGKYNIGDVWWTHFPFENSNIVKHRPAIVINDDEIAILGMLQVKIRKLLIV